MNPGVWGKGIVAVALGFGVVACGKKSAESAKPASTTAAPAAASPAGDPAKSPAAEVASKDSPAATKPPAPTPAAAPASAESPAQPKPARKKTGSAATRGAVQRPGDLGAQISALRAKLGLPAKAGWKELRTQLEQRASREADAALLLGLVLAYEPEFVKERGAAKEWLEKAAGGGNARAMAELGRLWLADDASANAPSEAERWLKAAWTAGESEGAFLLAIAQRLGLLDAVTDNPIRLLMAASEQGNSRAAVLLSLLNREEPLPELEPAQILAGLERAAVAGNVLAMLELADLNSRAGDTASATQWYEKAAIAGSPEAPLRLVTLARKQGPQGRESFARAIDLLRAQTHDPVTAPADSFLHLAALIAPGANTPEKLAEVKRLLGEATARGNNKAQLILVELDRGTALRDAVVASMKLSPGEVFTRLAQIDPAPAAQPPEADGSEFVGPKPDRVVEIIYPAELKASGVGGKVVLEFTVDVDGSVKDISGVKSPHPALTAAAIEAVQQWKFTPGMRHGKPSPVKLHLPVTIKVPGES